jgi:hypothetical protein
MESQTGKDCMPFHITREWTIDLSEDIQHRVEDEKLIFWQTGRTIIIVAYSLPPDKGKLELLNQIQKNQPEDCLETLVSTKGEIVGFGYTRVTHVKEDQKRLSLTTFTASDSSCLQIAFYLDDPADLDWAKSLWESLIYHPEAHDADNQPDRD